MVDDAPAQSFRPLGDDELAVFDTLLCRRLTRGRASGQEALRICGQAADLRIRVVRRVVVG